MNVLTQIRLKKFIDGALLLGPLFRKKKSRQELTLQVHMGHTLAMWSEYGCR